MLEFHSLVPSTCLTDTNHTCVCICSANLPGSFQRCFYELAKQRIQGICHLGVKIALLLQDHPSGRDTQPLTVDGSLVQYLQTQGNDPPGVKSRRSDLVRALKANPQCPESWWGFLKHEEAVLANGTGSLQRSSRHSTLFHLFSLATQTIPRQGNYENPAYLHIWLGYARQQWCAFSL